MRVIPNSHLGKWSLGLVIAMPLLLLLGGSLSNTLYKSIEAGDGLFDDVIQRPLVAVASLAGIFCGIIAFIVGLIAITKKKDDALLVYLPTILGALLILFILADTILPGE